MHNNSINLQVVHYILSSVAIMESIMRVIKLPFVLGVDNGGVVDSISRPCALSSSI